MGRIKPLPRTVQNKKGDEITYGKVIDEAVHKEYYPGDEDFIDLIQLIEWESGDHSIRICYYVRPNNSGDDGWTFSNRPLVMGIEELKKLLKKASKKDWFKPALP